MPRQRYNNQSGAITDNPLTSGAVTFNSATLSGLPAVASPDYLAVILDPDTASEEIVWVMAHTAAATSATIWRAREGTTAVAHSLGSRWLHGPTKLDYEMSAGKPWFYLPAGWDDTWIQAKYNAATTPAWSALFGTSIAAAYGTTVPMTKGWYELVRGSLTPSQAALYADFYDLKFSVGTFGWNGFGPWSVDVQPVAPYNGGFNVGPSWTAITAAYNPFKLVTPFACTKIDIIVADGDLAATITYSIDGGVDQTYTTTAYSAANWGLKRIALTGLSNVVHTIQFKQQSVASAFSVLGAICYSGTVGLGFCRFAYNGGVTTDISRLDLHGNRKPFYVAGKIPGAVTGFGIPVQPHLLIIEPFGNDAGAPNSLSSVARPDGVFPIGAGPRQWADTLRNLCRAGRRGRDNCSILFVVESIPDGIYTETTESILAYNPRNYQSYTTLINDLAGEFNAGVVNFMAKWGQLGVTKGFLPAADLHPTDAGQQDMANTILQVI